MNSLYETRARDETRIKTNDFHEHTIRSFDISMSEYVSVRINIQNLIIKSETMLLNFLIENTPKESSCKIRQWSRHT